MSTEIKIPVIPASRFEERIKILEEAVVSVVPTSSGDGKDGQDGRDGLTPVKGVDYFDGVDGKDGVDGVTPIRGVDYFDGEDGADSTVEGPKGDPGDPANITLHESMYSHTLLHSNAADHAAHSDDQDLSEKVDKEMGKGLSANDFTAELKSKLDDIATGAVADHADISNRGTNTHAQIDTFIGTKAQALGLASLDADSNVVQGATLAKGGITYTALADGTLALAFGVNSCVTVTPTATGTFTTTVPAAGVHCWLIILTTGTTSRTMTFGTGFKSTGTLATGTTSGRTFVVHFISDGTKVIESGRTVAMA
jgi:hypothetical protein